MIGRRTIRIALVGLPGAGKSTVGQLLADRLGWKYFDCDAEMQTRAGASIADWVAARGWDAFRRHEREILADALSGECCLIATGGGVVEDENNRVALAAASTVVWLDAPPGVLLARLGNAEDRPLLAGDPLTRLTELAERRNPFYAELADIRVDASGPTEQVLATIMQSLRPEESI